MIWTIHMVIADQVLKLITGKKVISLPNVIAVDFRKEPKVRVVKL